MAAPGFRENPKLYDVLLLGGVQVPGEWDCPQLGRASDIKAPKSDGKSDGNIRDAGVMPSTGVINIKLDTDAEEREWEALIAKIYPIDRPQAHDAVSVENPIFKRLSIRAIYVTGIDNPIPTAGDPQHVAIHWRSAKLPGGKSGTRKIKSAKKEEIELRPNALTDTPAQQAKAAGGR